jgi:CspA family cold shock protein
VTVSPGHAGRGRQGTVRDFDAERGLGTIAGDDGVTYPFHCAEIADGSRHVDVGARVTFAVIAKLGRYEAADIAP